MPKVRRAIFWVALTLAQSLADLHRSGYSGSGWIVLLYYLFHAPSSFLVFVSKGRYLSKYGGAYLFDMTDEDKKTIERMSRDCPPVEVLAAYALGQLETKQNGRIQRGLIHAHVTACDYCADQCRIVRESFPEPPSAQTIVFK